MPIYEYRCENGHTFEVIQTHDRRSASTTCEVCGAPVERVFHPLAVHFKGSGFYTTDYGTKKRAREKSAADGAGDGQSEERRRGGERMAPEAAPRPTAARRRPTRARRAARRSAALALVALGLLPAASGAAAEGARFSGQVTDALRTPTHRLAAGANGRAVADLVFVDARQAHTKVRTCVRRLDARGSAPASPSRPVWPAARP